MWPRHRWTLVTCDGRPRLVFGTAGPRLDARPTSVRPTSTVREPAGTGGYSDLRSDADQLQVATDPPLTVLVASLADIIRSKQAAGRAKDLASLPLLRQTLAEKEGAS